MRAHALLALALCVLAVLVGPAAGVGGKPRKVARLGEKDKFGHVAVSWAAGDRSLSKVRRVAELDRSLSGSTFNVEKVGKSLSVMVQGKIVMANERTLREIMTLLVTAARLEQAQLILDFTEVTHLAEESVEKIVRPALALAQAGGVRVAMFHNPLQRGVAHDVLAAACKDAGAVLKDATK